MVIDNRSCEKQSHTVSCIFPLHFLELPAGKRDERKCPMPNTDHCGRSPTIMSVDYADILELSDELFARKVKKTTMEIIIPVQVELVSLTFFCHCTQFDDTVDSAVKDIIDEWRVKREEAIQNGTLQEVVNAKSVDFEGHGVLIVAKETVESPTPLCLGLGSTGNEILLTPCFHDWVPPTLGDQWETGGVVRHETHAHTRWEVGPCTSDGHVERT
jgi:hypothetical protein